MRQQRELERQRRENRIRKKRRRTIITLIILFILIIAVAAECVILFRMTDIDSRFTRAVQRGVHEGWALNSNELQLYNTGTITDTSFIEQEYAAISEYRNHRYKDDELGTLANEYIAAITACRKAAHRNDPKKDFNAFWSEFSEPYGRRLQVLYKLENGDFDMDLANEQYTEEYVYMIAQGWLLDKIEELEFIQTETEGGIRFDTSIRNDTGYDIEYINLDIELSDPDGKVVENVSAYARDIDSDGMINLNFLCTANKAVKYRVTGEVCKLGKYRGDTEVSEQ